MGLGGLGGAGQLKITPYSSPPFKTLIAHRPPLGVKKTYQPMVSVGGGADAPDGTHQYVMPLVSQPPALNANSVFTSAVAPWTALASARKT